MDFRSPHAHDTLADLALEDALGVPTREMSLVQTRVMYGRIASLVDSDVSQPYASRMPAGSVTGGMEQALLVISLLI